MKAWSRLAVRISFKKSVSIGFYLCVFLGLLLGCFVQKAAADSQPMAAPPASTVLPAILSIILDDDDQVALTVNRVSNNGGTGTVTSTPAGINCGSTCSASFNSGVNVTLIPTPAAGSTFGGWSGACTNATGNCVVSMTEARTVTATFNAIRYPLTVSKVGSGTVTSTPAGINCGSTCSANFNSGVNVTLIPTPAAGSTFGGWGGACTNATGNCVVSMTAARTVTATFNTPPGSYSLNVNKLGSGSGTVTSTPAGINCGSACSANFNSGVSVTLIPTAASGSVFAGWSGACTNTTGNCVVSMTAARTVTATFNVIIRYPLAVSKVGSGTVTSTPAGINCGSTCNASFNSGVNVTLIPTPAAGSTFGGWSGACTNATGNCVVSMTAARNVMATFKTIVPYLLTVKKVANLGGAGTVTSNPAGINCGLVCSKTFNSGVNVTLIPTAASGSVFAGWTGACTNPTGNCVVSMTAVKTATATFNGKVSGEVFPPNGAWPSGWTTPTTAHARWLIVSGGAHKGNYSLRSGGIGHNQKSQVQISRTFKAGTVSFARKVSSQSSFDFLRFYIDGVKKGEWSGEQAWGFANYPLTAGTHTLLWSYEKNGSTVAGSDAAWIDTVTLPPASTSCQSTLTPGTTVTGSWAAGCNATHRPGSYAKYYTFTLSTPRTVVINLTSAVDSYLYLLSGNSVSGAVIAEDDDSGGAGNAQITQALAAGTYTVEATTYSSATTGSFSVSVKPQ